MGQQSVDETKRKITGRRVGSAVRPMFIKKKKKNKKIDLTFKRRYVENINCVSREGDSMVRVKRKQLYPQCNVFHPATCPKTLLSST